MGGVQEGGENGQVGVGHAGSSLMCVLCGGAAGDLPGGGGVPGGLYRCASLAAVRGRGAKKSTAGAPWAGVRDGARPWAVT